MPGVGRWGNPSVPRKPLIPPSHEQELGMTTPDERTRNLLQAGAFLKELQEDKTVPEEIRQEAHRLLRHYPTVYEVRMLAELEKHTTGAFYLTPNIEKGWFSLYRFGAHTG